MLYLLVVLVLFALGSCLFLGTRSSTGDKILDRAFAMGAICYQNSDNQVIALCRADDLNKELSDSLKKFKSGDINPWGKMLFFAKPTYTFWADEARQSFTQVGSKEDFRELCYELVEKAMGIKRSSWLIHRSIFDAAVEFLIPREPRLFIPFVSEGIKKFEEQVNIYGRGGNPLNDVRSYLFLPLETQPPRS